MRKLIIVILTVIALMPLHSVSADWARSFVVYSGDIYEITNEIIPSNEIDKEIGHVTKYSDHEGTYTGNFSNTFPKGTPYYSIKNVNSKEIIAIQTKEKSFVKAINKGHYDNDHLESRMFWIYFILGSLIIVVLLIGLMRRRNLDKGKQHI